MIAFIKSFTGISLLSFSLAGAAPVINSQLDIDSASLIYVDSAQMFNAIPAIAVDAYDYLSGVQKSDRISRFIFVRHGQSTSNAEKSIAGRIDVDLSELGADQALKAGKKMAETKIAIDAVYSSPSKRAKRTAELILNKPVMDTDDRLYEKFYGPYEGASEHDYKPVKQAEEGGNSGPDKLFKDKFSFKAHPDMESMADVYARTFEFLEDAHQAHCGENVLIGTHNGVMKALFIAFAAKQGFDVDYRSFDLGNASIVVVEVEDNGIRVIASNGLKYHGQPNTLK